MLKRQCYLLLALGLNLIIISGCTINCLHFGTEEFTETFDLKDNIIPEDFTSAAISSQAVNDCVNPSGDTLESRILPPAGYIRSPTEENSLASFLRTYPVKESDSPLLLYDGTIKKNQSAHAAILQLPLEAEDFQQCADSIMRIYAEYYLSIGEEEKIRFHFTTGFVAEYAKWMEGYRIDTKNGEFRWVKSAGYDASYENFTRYMRMVFAYANTFSMDAFEAKSIDMANIQIGDIWLEDGSPGHAMMVVDICFDENGNKAFLLAQGHMPAQEFEVMNNPLHPDDPWYYEEEVTYPFITDVHEFGVGSLQRLNYFP